MHTFTAHVRLLNNFFIGVNPSEGALCAGLSNRCSLLLNIIGRESFVNRNRLAGRCVGVSLLSYTRLRAAIESLPLPVYHGVIRPSGGITSATWEAVVFPHSNFPQRRFWPRACPEFHSQRLRFDPALAELFQGGNLLNTTGFAMDKLQNCLEG